MPACDQNYTTPSIPPLSTALLADASLAAQKQSVGASDPPTRLDAVLVPVGRGRRTPCHPPRADWPPRDGQGTKRAPLPGAAPLKLAACSHAVKTNVGRPVIGHVRSRHYIGLDARLGDYSVTRLKFGITRFMRTPTQLFKRGLLVVRKEIQAFAHFFSCFTTFTSRGEMGHPHKFRN